MLCDGCQRVRILSQIYDDTSYHNQGCNGITGLGDESAETFQLFVERGFHAVIYLCGYENLTVFRMIAYGKYAHHAISFHHLRSAHCVVGWESCIVVLFLRSCALSADWFSRQCGFIYLQLGGFKQFAVGRNLAASSEYHNIPHYDVTLGNQPCMSITYHLNGLLIVHLIEDGKFAVGFHLKDECQSGSQQDGNEDSYGFKENGSLLVKSVVFVERNADGKNTSHEENDDQGIGKFPEKFLPKRFPFRRSQYVDTILLPVM